MLEEILRGDVAWTPAEALDMVRGRAPERAPGDDGRAHYSDTNYQLLHLLIDAQDGSYEESVASRVCEPLGLEQTYVFSRRTLSRYTEIEPLHYGEGPLELPQAMASFGADGGLVSTADEQLTFMEAFMGGRLFSTELLRATTATWHPMFFPLEYGLGMMRYRLPRVFSPFSPMPALVGHSGASGSVLFHDPARSLTIAGSINQLRRRSQVFKVLSRLERALR
jgi:D-alanyl-D-alanine carboxypeptidase